MEAHMTRDAENPLLHEGPKPGSSPDGSNAPATKPGFVARYLDPASRMGEVLFGLIMVLSMTLTAEIAAGGHAPARELIIAAVGCNIAWGLIDAFMYLMDRRVALGDAARLARSVREASTSEASIALLQDRLGEQLDPLLSPADRTRVYGEIHQHLLVHTPQETALTRKDFLGALACFWLVFFSCLPAAIPFFIVSEPARALRLSNLLLLAMLFLVGYRWAGYAGTNRLLAGLTSLALGMLLVGIAVLLGG